jgi:hypothetical protein
VRDVRLLRLPWNVFFSPFLSAAPILLPALGFALAKKSAEATSGAAS